MDTKQNAIEGIAPVFLWAPAARCGITLLQRLISSSGEILIYGENLFLTVTFPTHMLHMVRHEAEGERARQRLAAGDCNFWSSAAFPRMHSYRRSLHAAFCELVTTYDRATHEDGFARWGLKTPGADPSGPASVLRTLLPDARHVFIYRHVEDVIASYKARRWLPTPHDVFKQATRWNAHVLETLAAEENDHMLIVRYENLVGNPAQEAERLRAFLGVAHIDLSILEHKFNTFTGTEEVGFSPRQYIAPEPLTPVEVQLVRNAAGPAMARAGYRFH